MTILKPWVSMSKLFCNYSETKKTVQYLKEGKERALIYSRNDHTSFFCFEACNKAIDSSETIGIHVGFVPAFCFAPPLTFVSERLGAISDCTMNVCTLGYCNVQRSNASECHEQFCYFEQDLEESGWCQAVCGTLVGKYVGTIIGLWCIGLPLDIINYCITCPINCCFYCLCPKKYDEICNQF